jgi:hypothetical protein
MNGFGDLFFSLTPERNPYREHLVGGTRLLVALYAPLPKFSIQMCEDRCLSSV